MNTEFLREFALQKIWCSPFEDEQSILELKRLTPINGQKDYIELFHDCVVMPTAKTYYHIYMVGGNFPGSLTFPFAYDQWFKLSDWAMESLLDIKLYTNNGILLPLSLSYVKREEDDNFLIAIPILKKLPDLNYNKVYMRLYHSQFFTSDSSRPINRNYWVLGGLKENTTDIGLALQKEAAYGKLAKIKGDVSNYRFPFINGKMVSGGTERYRELLTEDDDTFEVVYDGSIYRETWFRLKSLKHFESKLDKCRKYLLHWPKDRNETQDIHYRDDLDIYIIKCSPQVDSKGKGWTRVDDGRYYHVNREEAIRMVTHSDWSLPVDFVREYIRDMDPAMNTEYIYIRCVVKRAGFERKLINERNHIRELYRLPTDNDIVNAMVGSNATVEFWRAENLEASSYTYLMRAYKHEITDKTTLEAIGYVSASRALANPVISITRDVNGDYFKLPVGLMTLSTIYEYDKYGLLLGYYIHRAANIYRPKHAETIYVEAIAGEGSINPDIRINPASEIKLYPNSQYRVYASKLDNRGIVTTWRDVTKEGTYYHRSDDNVGFFKYDSNNESLMVLGDGHFLAYTQEVNEADGVFDLSLVMNSTRTPIPVPFGKIDLWMNGHALVEGIDYYVSYPTICVVTKKYINHESETQSITVRGTGFVSSAMERITPREVGFVAYGRVSVDNHYDLHDEDISRVSVAGGIVDARLLNFDERTGEASVRPIQDGAPYSIEDFYIPLRALGTKDLYELLEDDRERFKLMTDYLSRRLKPVKEDLNPVIPNEYFVYSPVMSALIKDIQEGNISVEKVNVKDKMQLEKIMSKYKRFLPVDPAALGVNTNFVTVTPYPQDKEITLTYRGFQLLEAINQTYLNNLIQLNLWVKVARPE